MKKSLTLITLLLLTIALQAQQHGWRGPQRMGVYPETGLMKQWPEEGPELLWETMDAGKGYSSPVIVGERIYITGMNQEANREIFSAYTLEGEKLYELEYGHPWDQTFPETRTTPTIDGKYAYVISGMGEIVCIDTEKGAIQWKVDGGTLFERKTGRWGTCESPLIDGNKIFYSPAGDHTTMVALDKETGDLIWKSNPLGDNSSYVSPVMIEHNGIKQIIGITSIHVMGIDPDNGTIMWTFKDWGRDDGENIATNSPLYKEGKIFASNGYDMGSFMLQLNDDLTGVELLWRNDVFDTHIGGYVLVDDVIYGSNWINNGQGNWMAIDWNTGETLYDQEWGGRKSKGVVIAADDMLYCYDERFGTVGLVNPNKEKFDVVSEFRVTKGEGPHWAHPVINDGVLYMRHGPALMAFKMKE